MQTTPADSTKNPPIANAGTDQNIYSPPSIATLDGSLSKKGDNDITTYLWTKISGPASYSISNANSIQTPVTGLDPGVYNFELKVTDAAGLFSVDTIQITVKQIPVLSCDPNRPVIQAHLIPIGKLSAARYDMAVASAGNKILFAGGTNSSDFTTRVDIYDIGNNSWTTSELSIPRQGIASASLGNKIFFAGGGQNASLLTYTRIDIYDVSANQWSTAELSLGREYLSAATIGDNVYFTGGGNWDSGPFGGTDMIDIYNNISRTWSQDHLSEPKVYHTATAVGNKLYVAGGVTSQNIISSEVDIYDAASKTWSNTNMAESKYVHGAIAVNNKIYWASGGIQSGESDQVQILDISSGTSTFSCVYPKEQFGVVTKDDKIIFFTGHISNFPEFDIYDLTTDSWSTGVLDINLSSAAIISINNVIYVAGGYTDGVSSHITNGVWKLEF